MKNIALWGATGSIGKNTINIVRSHSESFNVKYLSFHQNWKEGLALLELCSPEKIIVTDKNAFKKVRDNTGSFPKENVIFGMEKLLELCTDGNLDLVVNALVGEAGLLPTIKSLEANINVALANKESLVMAGEIINRISAQTGAQVFPIDSEHSAIWQCLVGEDEQNIKKIILTASGGPFRKMSEKDLNSVTVKMALNHPNWSMGKKITIDSATLMNKGLEFIEAFWLYPVSSADIDVVVHPQSIIHSLVEFIDGSLKAQLGFPDMKIPIQYALSFPDRLELKQKEFNLSEIGELNFEPVRHDAFPAINIAKSALQKGGVTPAVLNVANEYAVYAFLDEKIAFLDIVTFVNDAISKAPKIEDPHLEDILEAGAWAKNYIENRIK